MSNARLTILQARAVKDKKVSDSQFRTLAALGMYANEDGWCYPLLSTLGKDLGKSKQAVGRDTIALRKHGYLEVQARYDEKGARRSSLYRLKYDLPPVNVDDSTPAHVDTPSTPEVDTPSTPEVDVNVPLNDPINPRSKISKKGDLVDGVLFFAGQAKDQQADKVEEVIQTLERGLKVNITRSTKNQAVAKRLLKDARPLERFLQWIHADEWRSAHTYLYAELERVWRDFPQAFPSLSTVEVDESKGSFYG